MKSCLVEIHDRLFATVFTTLISLFFFALLYFVKLPKVKIVESSYNTLNFVDINDYYFQEEIQSSNETSESVASLKVSSKTINDISHSNEEIQSNEDLLNSYLNISNNLSKWEENDNEVYGLNNNLFENLVLGHRNQDSISKGDYNLKNRKLLHICKYDKANEEGIVVVEIKVDKKGNVIEAIPNGRGTNTSSNVLRAVARQAALCAKFSPSEMFDEQVGTITFKFEF